MRRVSLTVRLTILLMVFSFLALSIMGSSLYYALQRQLEIRDDAALLTRVDQIATLLHDIDARQLIDTKPHLFANMLGNTESLLVIRYVNGPTLLEVNPLQQQIPAVKPTSKQTPLQLSMVHHSKDKNGIPMIYMSTLSRSPASLPPLEIISGRTLTERTHILNEYRNNIILFSLMMAILLGCLALMIAKYTISPLQQLANQTSVIGSRTLSFRLKKDHAPVELEALIDQLNAMLNRLEQGFQQIKQVSADMAHDLRTPVSTLLGQTEVGLSKARDNHYYRTLLGSNYEELQRMSRMIDNMLFLAQAEQPDMAIQHVKFDTIEEIERVSDYFEDLASERNIDIQIRGHGTVIADALLFRRALANLLSNAVRYAYATSTIEIIAEDVGDGISLQVINQGDPISPQHQERIFDRFYRIDSSRHDSEHASGLGLSIIKSIMQLHKGYCWVDSNANTIIFGLFFPIQK